MIPDAWLHLISQVFNYKKHAHDARSCIQVDKKPKESWLDTPGFGSESGMVIVNHSLIKFPICHRVFKN